MTPPCIVLIAGEPSGDVLGAGLMKALRPLLPYPVRFSGIGGPLMQAQGLETFFSMDKLTTMGFTDVLTKIPELWRLGNIAEEKILSLSPQALITIDFPGFNFRLAKRLKGKGIPLIHYVAPTVWAGRPKRAAAFAEVFDHILALFPFEAPYFEKVGLPLTFVGHPVIEKKAPSVTREHFLTSHHLPHENTVLTVLPGSRVEEVERLLPIFKEAVEGLKRPLVVLVPTVPSVKSRVESHLKGWTISHAIIEGEEQKLQAFHISDVALAASGTVSLELAKANLPMVIAYKVSSLTAFIAKRIITIPYVSLVNILNKDFVVPEFLQDACIPHNLTDALALLLDNEEVRTRQKQGLLKAIQMVTPPQGHSPSQIAANTLVSLLKSKNE